MECAGKLLRRLKLPAGSLTPESLARAAWPLAVGARLATHTRPVSLYGSRLVVEVEDAVWQRQLNTLRKAILEKMQAICGAEPVTEIEFRVGIPRRLPQRAEAPADEAERIADPSLRRVYRISRQRSLPA